MIISFLDYGPPTRSSPHKQTLPAASSSDEEENVSYYSSNYENDDNVIVEDPRDENLRRRKQYGKVLVGQLTHVSAKCLDHVCCIWKVSKSNQSSITFFTFYLWITSKKQSYQQLMLEPKLELRHGLILILMSSWTSWEYFFPWRCTRYMDQEECIEIQEEQTFFLLWIMGK